jgi:hypothetical protein
MVTVSYIPLSAKSLSLLLMQSYHVGDSGTYSYHFHIWAFESKDNS